jgi:hypothetical protein
MDQGCALVDEDEGSCLQGQVNRGWLEQDCLAQGLAAERKTAPQAGCLGTGKIEVEDRESTDQRKPSG